VNFVLIAAALIFVVILFTLFVRSKDLPPAVSDSPVQHLETRKSAIYENLRDLHFEYRVGKLSDDDYQRTKKEMQAELAVVLGEIDSIQQAKAAPVPQTSRKPKAEVASVCPHCGSKFDKPLKFCGECGKAMAETA
jgi:hypothetical protein